MNYNLELQKIELKLKEVVIIEDRIALLKQAINIADVNNDLDWGFDFRLNLIAEEVNTARCVESFSAFSWILDTWEKNQDLFSENEFLWEYKWMANASYRNVNISREQVEKILEDLKLRMQRNGFSLRGYYSVLIAWNQFLGDSKQAEHFIELREAEARDDMSHCPACELDTKVVMELLKENYDEAIVQAHDLINKRVTCAHMPFVTLCELSYYLNKAKDPRAHTYYEMAVKELELIDKSDSSVLSTVSLLINYMIDNDRKKGLEYFEKYSCWEPEAEDSIRFTFSKNCLRLFESDKIQKMNLSPKFPLYNSDDLYNFKQLYIYYFELAVNLADKFDKRNGTDFFKNNLYKEINK
ncbi:hypothetical protein [Apibacter sp. HY039]|uniref:hypothetical protein n=1 Tax=Apibacter sp. HY039 TaxID=2501476 RepID=UPI000FEBF5CA|nr:hypothetical protein [Apibacter sp. HY039]